MKPPTPPSREERYTALRRLALRILSFLAGSAILYHEVVVTEDSELILNAIALYLMGVPAADLMAHVFNLPSRNKDSGQK
jgi:hypothetical protein